MFFIIFRYVIGNTACVPLRIDYEIVQIIVSFFIFFDILYRYVRYTLWYLSFPVSVFLIPLIVYPDVRSYVSVIHPGISNVLSPVLMIPYYRLYLISFLISTRYLLTLFPMIFPKMPLLFDISRYLDTPGMSS